MNVCQVLNWHKASFFVCVFAYNRPLLLYSCCRFCQLTKPGASPAKRLEKRIVRVSRNYLCNNVPVGILAKKLWDILG